jgi:membrane-associated phospholipid phosphatase
MAGVARADDEPPAHDGSPYQLDWAADAPVFGLGVVGFTLNFIEVRPAACLPSCEPPDDLNALDRTALGNYSPSAHTAADVLVIGLLTVPQIANLIDSRGRGWLEDTAVFLQALLLTQGTTQIFKGVTQRGAPVLYDDRVPLAEREGRDATRSFFSGHTSTAFMAATSYSVTYWLRHPEDPWRWVVLAATHSVALSVGLLKIHAGYHYPTDIAAGAIAGSSIGALVPLLHRRF